MRLSSSFHFLVLLISISISFRHGIVEAKKVREYTEAFKGSDDEVETIISIPEKPQSPPHAPAPPPPKNKHKPTHRIYEAREFLGAHNKIRKELGEPLLKWDRTLAHYARRFAGKRAVDCDMLHSKGPYGENIYWGADYSKHTAAAAVRAWAGENNYYNAMTNTCDPSKSCGHYKQIVWKTSTKLGCARVKCNNGGVYIICSYDPSGNYYGESPFDTPPTPKTKTTPTPKTKTTPTPTTPTPTPKTKTTPTPPVQTPKSPGAQTSPKSPSTPS